MDEKVNSLMGFLINLIQNVGTCSVFPCAHPRWIMMDPRIHIDQLRSASISFVIPGLLLPELRELRLQGRQLLVDPVERRSETKRGETRSTETKGRVWGERTVDLVEAEVGGIWG